jgi:hypothetical protein
MSSQDILETAKTSQLGWSTFEKKKKGVLRVKSPAGMGSSPQLPYIIKRKK